MMGSCDGFVRVFPLSNYFEIIGGFTQKQGKYNIISLPCWL